MSAIMQSVSLNSVPVMRYIEFCAGMGGTRAGLDASGWQCIQAIDSDADAVIVHRLAHGEATEADVTKICPKDLPDADVWVAGFPCQPFSSSGNRSGFGHCSGNVFESLTRLAKVRRPPLIVLENVEGLLTNKAGHTFSVVLLKLTKLNYSVDWLLLDLRWFGPPQTRRRLFMIAAQGGILKRTQLSVHPILLPGFEGDEYNAFAPIVDGKRLSHTIRARGSISQTEAELRPKIGKPQKRGPFVFGSLGQAQGDDFVSYDLIPQSIQKAKPSLSSIICPSFRYPEAVHSARYWSTMRGQGPTKIFVKEDRISHCVGTSLGGAPLFVTSVSNVKDKVDREAFLEYSNWNRLQDGLLVMRLRPDRAVLLFGPYTETLYNAITRWDVGDTRKYKLVGNMVAPICAKAVADLINEQRIRKAA